MVYFDVVIMIVERWKLFNDFCDDEKDFGIGNKVFGCVCDDVEYIFVEFFWMGV